MRPSHLLFVAERLREEDRVEFDLMQRSPINWALGCAAELGIHFTVMADFTPVACFGFAERVLGVGSAWMVSTAEFSAMHARQMKKQFDRIVGLKIFRIILADVRVGRAPACEFIERAGFRLMHVIPRYFGEGEDNGNAVYIKECK